MQDPPSRTIPLPKTQLLGRKEYLDPFLFAFLAVYLTPERLLKMLSQREFTGAFFCDGIIASAVAGSYLQLIKVH